MSSTTLWEAGQVMGWRTNATLLPHPSNQREPLPPRPRRGRIEAALTLQNAHIHDLCSIRGDALALVGARDRSPITLFDTCPVGAEGPSAHSGREEWPNGEGPRGPMVQMSRAADVTPPSHGWRRWIRPGVVQYSAVHALVIGSALRVGPRLPSGIVAAIAEAASRSYTDDQAHGSWPADPLLIFFSQSRDCPPFEQVGVVGRRSKRPCGAGGPQGTD